MYVKQDSQPLLPSVTKGNKAERNEEKQETISSSVIRSSRVKLIVTFYDGDSAMLLAEFITCLQYHILSIC